MTQAIVTDTNNIVVVTDSRPTAIVTDTNKTVIVSDKRPTTIVTGIMGPPGKTNTLAEIGDIDTTNLQNGSTLVYDTTTLKWVSTTLLNRQQVDCGEF